jgi:hypothetical protein
MSNPPPRVIRLGNREANFPSSSISQIESSNSLLDIDDGGSSLRARFARDGFVYLRGVLNSPLVNTARLCVLDKLITQGNVLSEETGLLLPECGLGCIPNLEGVNGTTHAPSVAAVLEGDPLRRVVSLLLNETSTNVRTFDYKWLRAMPREAFTGVHVDSIYMNRGSRDLITAWIPFNENATMELGALALLKGSHKAPSLTKFRATYGSFDTEEENGFQGSGWLTSDPFDPLLINGNDCNWVSGDFESGDVILFGLNTVHCSSANLTNQVRISADVRWQRMNESIDERYIGTLQEMKEKSLQRKKGGAFASDADKSKDNVTMDDLRKRWGI